jgi:LacI family transcriptional regulator
MYEATHCDSMSNVRRIALLMGQDLSFCRDAIRGIRAYAMQKSGWMFRNGPAELQIVPYLRDWRPHGIIANLFLPEVARQVVKLRKPVVDTACTLDELVGRVPSVDVDHTAVGRLAADHFIERGFVHFAFFGSGTARYSKMREESYRRRLAEAGFEVSCCYGEYVHCVPATTGWKAIEQKARQWLRQLPNPVAVFVSNDVPARNLADMCGQLRLRVPDQVAILGVDDDELECSLASPPLSSIAIPSERIGYEAARLLDRMMSGEKVPCEPVFLPPVRVVIRQSTDVLAIDDPAVASALAYIRQHARENISVAMVVSKIGIVRRDLERKFRAMLGCSILDELQRVRVELAKGLLSDTRLAMPAVARHSGFSNTQRLAVVFHQRTGMSPTAYRRQALQRAAGSPTV